jgi:serine/threonine protein kinase/WD40 repeat protein/tetratricopeptide (TPR) repeat protein
MTERSLFLEVLELADPAERSAYLDRACAGDPHLREKVEQLLKAHDQPGAFMESPALSPVVTIDRPISESPGTVIGPYKLLEQIGEGGFGIVFMAEQQRPIRRKVALKVLKPGMDTRQVVARFEAERQALALMDHPNIAHVLDGGETASGRPYFVMELVRGIPITDFCDQSHQSVRQRLELFVSVCQAVQHAHQKGIIHRDLKPTNVLVTLHDNVPVVKVIDFGIAKAMGQQLTDKTLFTNFAQLIGTPLYMSPEQAQLSGLDIDTRSDIYALGVLLYELLTGTTPFDKERLKTATYDEIRRIIREEEPAKPSTRISSLAGSGDPRRAREAGTVSASRQSDPKRLSQLFRGELDWIVMKALDKDRNRRYETASAFAADVQRYLHHEPVLACPPTLGYRLRKIVQRNKGPVLAASLVVLALVGGIIGTTWGLIRATHARQEAVAAQQQAVGQARQKERALKDKGAALTAAQKSKRHADERLFESYVAQARANRLSRRPGQRFETLAVLNRATRLAHRLKLPGRKFRDLRNAVIATLAMPDLHLAGPWNPFPADGGSFDFDEALAIYARTDQRGNCSIRRVADNTQIHFLRGLGRPALAQLSRDGKFVAVLHQDGAGKAGVAVHMWQIDRATPRPLLSEAQAHGVDFAKDNGRIALAYTDGAIRLFELPSGRLTHRQAPDPRLTREVGIALHPSEPVAAVWSYFASAVQLRDLRTGKVIATVPQPGKPISVAWHPDGRTFAVGYGETNFIQLYDRTTLKAYRTLRGAGFGAAVSFNHAGDRLAVRGWGGYGQLFDVGTGQLLFTTPGMAWGGRFSRDDRRLPGGIRDGKLGIWRVGDGREYRTLVRTALPEKGSYHSVAVSPDGRLLAAGMWDGIGLWDLAGGSELVFLPMEGGGYNKVLFEPTGALLTLCPSGLLRWPVRKDSRGASQVMGPPEPLPLPCGHCLEQSRDGRVIVTCDRAVGQEEPFAGGWILHAGKPHRPIRIDAGADIGSIAVSPNGRWVVTVTHSVGLAKVWDARNGRLVKKLADWGAGAPCFSPDGRWLANAHSGGRLLAVGTWKPGRRLLAHAFAPDGKLMAAKKAQGLVRLVHGATGRELATLEDPHLDWTEALVFAPDGGRLIGYSNGKVKGIHVWDLRLLRRRLVAMGLEGDWPALPKPTRRGAPARGARPLQMAVLGAELASDWNSLAKAVAVYSKAQAQYPAEAGLWYCRGLAYGKHQKWDKALADFSKALELKPDDVRTLLSRGSVYQILGRHQQAVADYTKAFALEPPDAFFLNLRGNSYLQLKQYHQALADYSKAIRHEPNQPIFWSNRGWTQAERGRWKKAAGDFAQAAALSPDNPIFSYWLALTQLELGNRAGYRKVCAAMVKRFTQDPNSEATHWAVWTCLLAPDAVADWKPLIRLAQRSLAARPRSYHRLNHLGMVLYRAGRYREAAKPLAEAEKAFKTVKKPLAPIFYNQLFQAMNEHRLGRGESARKWLRKALDEIKRAQARTPPDPGHGSWNRQRTIQRFRREAEELLGVKKK